MDITAMTAAGVTVLVDASGPGLPVIAYWGPELPLLDAEQATALIRAAEPVAGSNNLSPPPRVAILPEHATGWVGRPGLSGSAAGAGWSPSFQIKTLEGYGDQARDFVSGGAGTLVARAADDSGRLALRLDLQLLPTGLFRCRATLENRAPEPYALDDLVLSLPLPAEATELLDFGGRHNLERVPQRGPLHTGRTGADSAYVLAAGTPGFGFANGRIWAVHTAWSGNHTHYAERVFTGEQRIGGGELLLPGEVRLTQGESYRTPWIYAAYGNGLDEIAHRFHRHLRGRERPVGAHRPVTLNVWEAVYFDHDLDRLTGLAELAGSQPDGRRPGVHRQTLAFYRLLDEIRAAHPRLEIESCSSGGARADLEVLERADRIWVSDNIDPHDRQRMLRWTTQLIPPEFLGSHIASDRSHVTGRRHDLAFRAGTAVFGHLGIEWDLTEASPAQLAELGEWLAFFKEQRDLLLGGDLVRMDGYGDDVLVHGVVAPDRSRAIFAMAVLDSPYPDPPARLRFRGLEPARRYRVRPVRAAGLEPPWWDADGEVFSGAALEHVGAACPRVHPDQVVLYRADAVG
jgi:alpha-galactosidase